MYKCVYMFADGTNVLFSNDDFDYIVNFDGHGFKHLEKFGRWSNSWFDAETRLEITDPYTIRFLNLRCVDGNANCYKNITPGKMEKKESYYDVIVRICNEIGIIPSIKKIVVNNKTTIVLWEDGTKTIVRPSANDNYDLEAAVCAAIAKKIYGTNSAFKRMIKEKTVVQENKKKEKKDE